MRTGGISSLYVDSMALCFNTHFTRVPPSIVVSPTHTTLLFFLTPFHSHSQNYQPIRVEPYLKEVYHRRSIKYAFEVIKGLPTRVYLDMLSVEIPELLFTNEDWAEPVHYNVEKVPFRPFGG